MLENQEALESFIGFCDDMQIAEEGLFKKHMISVNKARDVKTEAEMKKNMYGEEPLIHLTGPDANQLKMIFTKMKSKGTWGSIAAGVNAANGYMYTSSRQQERLEDSGQEDAIKYKLTTYNNENYLIHRKFQLAETAKKK